MVPSPLSIVVLAMLFEEPMHPYRMQQLVKQRGKDQVVNVRARTSIHQTLARLQRDQLIEVQGTERNDKRPERTVYRITDKGREHLRASLRQMLAMPQETFAEFPAALATLPVITPGEAADALQERCAALDARIEDALHDLAECERIALPRLFAIETEYALAMLRCEREWTGHLVDDLRTERLTWSDVWLRSAAPPPSPPPIT